MPFQFSIPLKTIILFATAQIYTLSASAQGVIANDAAIFPFSLGGQYLTLTNSHSGFVATQITSPVITPDDYYQFTFVSQSISEEYALYTVGPGTVIDPAFATATTPLVSNNGIDPGSSVQLFDLGESRIFGYWVDRQSGAIRTPDIDDNYGWVVLTCTGSGLQVSSSATALGGGIIAGTLTQVPEPSAGALTLISICLLVSLKRSCFCRTISSNK
jgi:hypothetical protein